MLRITQIAFRADSANTAPFSGTIPQIQISLSTTASGVDALSANFADNLGSDLTVVYPMAPLAVASSAAVTGTGTGAFDLIVPFVTPFPEILDRKMRLAVGIQITDKIQEWCGEKMSSACERCRVIKSNSRFLLEPKARSKGLPRKNYKDMALTRQPKITPRPN